MVRVACPVQWDALTPEKAMVWEAERVELEAALAEVERLCRERGLLSQDDKEAEAQHQQQQRQQPDSPWGPHDAADGVPGVHALDQDASLAALLCTEGGGLTAIDAAMEARGYRSGLSAPQGMDSAYQIFLYLVLMRMHSF